MPRKIKKGRFIKASAKKWASLRRKQALANNYLREARLELGKDHKYYVNAMNRIHMFQKKHSQVRSNRLSMESLRTTDMAMYEALLDSILESTYINPNKYKTHKQAQYDFAIEQGWADNYEEAEKIYQLRDSSLFEDIEKMQNDKFASLALDSYYTEYVQNDLTLDEFKEMLKDYKGMVDSENLSPSEFFNYSDDYVSMLKEYKYGMENTLIYGLDDNKFYQDFKATYLKYTNELDGEDFRNIMDSYWNNEQPMYLSEFIIEKLSRL